MIKHFDIKSPLFSHLMGVLSHFHLSAIMKKLGFYKEKGVRPVTMVVHMIMSLLTCGSFNQYLKQGKYECDENLSKSAVYRFMSNDSYNWRGVHTEIAKVSTKYISGLAKDKSKFLIVDDSLYERSRSKSTQMMSRVYDHCDHKFCNGFQYLQVCYSDGYTTLPVDFALVGAQRRKESRRKFKSGKHKRQLMINQVTGYDKRTAHGKRLRECQDKKPNIAIAMIKRALNNGITAKYVMFDSWFTTAPTVMRIKEMGLDVIGMVKHMRNTTYKHGKDGYFSIHDIIDQKDSLKWFEKAEPNNEGILGSCIVETKVTANAPRPVKVKIVLVKDSRSSSSKKKVLAVLCTDTNLSNWEIISYYGYRWNIEESFYNQKQLLGLVDKCRANKFSSLITHVTLVNICSIILEIIRRDNADPRTFGGVFSDMAEQISDIPFSVAIDSLMQCFRKVVDTLDDANLIVKNKKKQAYAIVRKMLNEWYHQQGEFFQKFLKAIKLEPTFEFT